MDLRDTEDITGGLHEGDVLIRRYLLLERIAEGGMSVIWRAFDRSLQRTVAVKVLDGSFDGDRGGRELIQHEARATARLLHPDVIEVYDYGETITSQGRIAAFVVMRLLDGHPLAERLLEGPLPWREAAEIAVRLALVLSAAHGRGIVHRDVTPENVLLTVDGAKLLDFGIAAIEDEQSSERLADFGTPPYVAPERLKRVAAHPSIDVYALGVLLFEMLTGELPYPERTWEAIETVRRIGPPPVPAVPGLPPEVAVLCQRSLFQDPDRRPSAQHMADVLSRAIVRRRRRRSRRTMLTGVVAALSVTAAVIQITWTNAPSPQRQIIDAAAMWPSGTPAPAGRPVTSTPARSTPASSVPASSTPASSMPATSTAATNAPATAQPALPERESQPDGAGGRQGPRPGTSPTAATRVASAPPTVAEAVGRFNELLDRGMAVGEVRPDVAQDLRQVLHNFAWSSTDIAKGVADLRVKVTDRVREGALSTRVADDLRDQLKVIQAALQRSSQKA